uniref:Uncharacterized protein n=1 Tax=Marseillevirus LCMAC201 TaxID=2506605 RepID=A0A481YWL3_9VIRU|nr:MAG: hypothetical protein LCMAC201_00770 [Marseillevirus LCMAC201]
MNNECSLRFTIENLPKVEKYLYDEFVKEMLDYYCDGCSWCCYSEGSSKYICEKRYNKDELALYIKDQLEYRIDSLECYIEKITLTEGSNFLLEKKEETVWILPSDFGDNPTIKIDLCGVLGNPSESFI